MSVQHDYVTATTMQRRPLSTRPSLVRAGTIVSATTLLFSAMSAMSGLENWSALNESPYKQSALQPCHQNLPLKSAKT